MKKIFYSVFALILLFCVTTTVSFAQSNGHFCSTDEVQRQLIGRNPLLIESARVNEELLQNAIIENRGNRSDEVMVIPVVFHVIHDYGVENISDAQIHSAMNILNIDFRKLNDISSIVPRFDTLVADCKIEFRLATKDFLGNCTNGIERINSTTTYLGGLSSKLSQWPRDRYLNIWVVKNIVSDGIGQTLGYSQLPPYVVGADGARRDGIVALYNSVGDIEEGIPSRSKTLTHEVGHYLNLLHTWGDGNEPGISCDGTDAVDDTPQTKGHFGGCDLYDFECMASYLPTTPMFQFGAVTTSSGLVDPTSVYQATNQDITLSSFSANGVSANPVANGTFGFSNWGVGAEDGEVEYNNLGGTFNPNKYYQFTVTPTPGRAFSLNSLNIHVKRSLNGPRTFSIRASHNSYSANIVGTTNNPRLQVMSGGVYFFKEDTTSTFLIGNTINLPASPDQNLTFRKRAAPITFRIYAWNSEDLDGSFEIDNVTIDGSHGQIANTQNFMDYSDCHHMYTEGQKERMRAALSVSTAGRNNLWSELNRINTGTWDPTAAECPPKADFYAANRFACMNTPIQFFDNSTNATVNSWHWTFQDGSPATSTEQNPSVSFTSGGNKTVTLTVTGTEGEDTKTIQSVVRIAPNSPEFWDIPLQEGFDSQEDFWYQWIPINVDNTNSSWQRVANVGYSNNTSARLNAFDMNVTDISSGGGAVDELVSPSFTLAGLSNVSSLTFRYAYATQSPNASGVTDKLEIKYSTDCGVTWSSFTSGTINQGSSNPVPVSSGTISGLSLASAGNHSTFFTPSDADDWNHVTMNFPSLGSNSRIRLKFVFTAGEYPNNLYLDDINLNATVGIDEIHSDITGINLFPNPSQYSTTLTYTNKTNNPVQISLIDLSGRVVEAWTPNINAPGQQTLNINTADLAKGVYMVNLKSEQNNVTLRLLVQ